MFVDTHSHLNFKDFDTDRYSLIEECLNNNVYLINVGTTFFDSRLALEIAKKYPKGVYASVGIHPLYVENQEFKKDNFKKLALDEKVVAIGEIGLDYFYSPKELSKEEYIEKQKDIFLKQLELAEGIRKPVIIHIRDAFEDAYEILKTKKVKGVIHCFTGNKNDLKNFINRGYYIGINGIIFKVDMEEVIKEIPNDKILFETDCPYLTSPWFYEKRNNPLGVVEVAKKVNEIKGEDITEQVFKNSLKFINNEI